MIEDLLVADRDRLLIPSGLRLVAQRRGFLCRPSRFERVRLSGQPGPERPHLRFGGVPYEPEPCDVPDAVHVRLPVMHQRSPVERLLGHIPEMPQFGGARPNRVVFLPVLLCGVERRPRVLQELWLWAASTICFTYLSCAASLSGSPSRSGRLADT